MSQNSSEFWLINFLPEQDTVGSVSQKLLDRDVERDKSDLNAKSPTPNGAGLFVTVVNLMYNFVSVLNEEK